MAGPDGESTHPRMTGFGGRGSAPSSLAALIWLTLLLFVCLLWTPTPAAAIQFPRLVPPATEIRESGDAGPNGLAETTAASPTGRWIVAGRPGRATRALARKFDASPISRSIGIYALDEEDASGFISSLSRIGAYRFSEPDVRATPATVRSEDGSDSGQIDQWWLDQVNRPLTQPKVTKKSPTLALLEDSLDPNHPDLGGLRTRGSLIGAFSQRNVSDAKGTAMAALAMSLAGNGDDGKLTGVWPGMKVRLVRSANSCAEKAKAVYQAAEQKGNRVLLMGYGFTGNARCFTHYAATEYAVFQGLIPVAEAPVAGAGPTRPAGDPHVLTVTATDREGDVPIGAGQGPSVDLAAPGDALKVAWVTRNAEGRLSKTWESQSGTAYSATIVAAAAAWVMNERPLTARQVIRLFTDTANREVAGSSLGRLDIAAALKGSTPVNDPFEPNDDIDWVRARPSLLEYHRGKKIRRKPFWRSGQRHKRTVATLSRTKDPADVYRLRLDARSKVRIKLTSNDDIRLKVLKPGASSRVNPGKDKIVLQRSVKARKTYRITLKNRSRKALTAFLALEARPTSPKRDGFSYRISVAPRR